MLSTRNSPVDKSLPVQAFSASLLLEQKGASKYLPGQVSRASSLALKSSPFCPQPVPRQCRVSAVSVVEGQLLRSRILRLGCLLEGDAHLTYRRHVDCLAAEQLLDRQQLQAGVSRSPSNGVVEPGMRCLATHRLRWASAP